MTSKWPMVPLGDAADIYNGATPKTGVPQYWGGDHQWVTPAEMGKLVSPYLSSTSRTLTQLGLESSNTKLMPEYSVIMSCRAPIGHLVINTEPMSFNQGCKGLVAGDKLDHKFLYYFLLASKEYLNSLGNGTTFAELSSSKLKEVSLPLPPLDEQKRIVEKLDQALGYVDEVSIAARASLDEIDGMWKKALADAFNTTASHNPGTHLGQQQLTASLRDLCSIKTGKKDANEGSAHGVYPFFTCAREPLRSDSFSFDAKAILIAGNGQVGQATYYEGKFEAYQRTYVLQDFKSTDEHFLFYYIDGFLKQHLEVLKMGNTMPYIKLGMLQDFKVPFPPLDEQKRIVEKLDILKIEVEALKSLKQSTVDQAESLRSSILTAAFAGEL